MPSKLFDVYFHNGFRILSGVTPTELHDYCEAHGYRHFAEQDHRRGVIYWDAFVGKVPT